MKKILFALFLLLVLPGIACSEEDIFEDSFEDIAEEDIYDGIPVVELQGDAGMTPDSTFYFLETLLEDILVGNDPETALEYKEEKLLEAKEMIRSGNKEAAEKALRRVGKYNHILQKEVSPELDIRVRETSKATKDLLSSLNSEIEGDEWGQVKEIIGENLKNEDKVALAAKISKKIRSLCETLSELDPLEYSKMCKPDQDAPQWKKEMDRTLTGEQEREAREFFTIMSDCFQDPASCRCDDISVKPFADQCNVIAPLAAQCEKGDEQACEEMESIKDPIDLLPGYLQDVLIDIEDKYGKAKHDLHVPAECVKEGALSREACMKVMFKVHTPPACQEALESGRIDPKNEREARQACEEIMFDLEAPPECKEAGLSDSRECERYMFKLDAPQECLDAGLTGSGKEDWKKCDIIRFKLDAPRECLDAGITGEKRDDWKKCELIKFKVDAPQECLDAGLTGAGRDDWRRCEAIRFRLEAPQECLDAGLTGEGRDDWRRCEIIRFKVDAPQECLDAGLTGAGRDDWRKCEAIKFRSEAHPACLAAGLTGEGRDDWRKCQRIQFREEAPRECLEAGLDGSGRNDWDECNRIREVTGDRGPRREDCRSDQLHICEGGSCECVDREVHDWNDPYRDCGAADCQPDRDFVEPSECKDGCSDECPGADRTDCVNDRCQCYYHGASSEGDTGSGTADGGTGARSDSGAPEGGSDAGGTDAGDAPDGGAEESTGSDTGGDSGSGEV